MRLGTVGSQLSSLRQKAVALKRMGYIYQQRLERTCSDLQKAEAEVDLLGDQVDTLSNFLDKVYIGLDHYSPILQHYPGIMEVLKLVRKELTGESSS
ncbi:WPP domain-associated protein-like [Eucalyptus grandis]|uniref:WPP domain-associated protein-like n=1 Tax=Eucalyptus grandis TaxID=71139 RepID=UPI00192EFD4D|nr:WPP domain-associated protein-like [Eucalyptus grandis]